MNSTRQHLAAQYRELLAEIYQGCAESCAPELPPELKVQSWWAAGLLPSHGETQHHEEVHILERGRWNRAPGPDFTHAEIELGGQRIRGDIEIDPRAQDWEAHGHGANPAFNNVALHIVLTPPPEGWYTRNQQHRNIPVLYLPPASWQQVESNNTRFRDEPLPRCRKPLADMPAESIIRLLKAAAAYRQEKKRHHFHQRLSVAGEAQAWYEAWATTLGYSANKEAMQMLAMRAPLQELGKHAEAILLGTAGFLFPVLPERCESAAREYHRRVWDSWWFLRERFELSSERSLPWNPAPVRPMNHPQRRVAALATTAKKWKQILPLLNAAGVAELSRILTGITHTFWDTHYTLASAPMRKATALVGQQRVADFLINHVYAYDEHPASWENYLALRCTPLPPSTRRTAELLFGTRDDLKSILSKAYAQQALRQIDADFCTCNICLDCAFPVQLTQWLR